MFFNLEHVTGGDKTSGEYLSRLYFEKVFTKENLNICFILSNYCSLIIESVRAPLFQGIEFLGILRYIFSSG